MIIGPNGKVELADDAKKLMGELADRLKEALDADAARRVPLAETHVSAEYVEFMLRDLAAPARPPRTT